MSFKTHCSLPVRCAVTLLSYHWLLGKGSAHLHAWCPLARLGCHGLGRGCHLLSWHGWTEASPHSGCGGSRGPASTSCLVLSLRGVPLSSGEGRLMSMVVFCLSNITSLVWVYRIIINKFICASLETKEVF